MFMWVGADMVAMESTSDRLAYYDTTEWSNDSRSTLTPVLVKDRLKELMLLQDLAVFGFGACESMGVGITSLAWTEEQMHAQFFNAEPRSTSRIKLNRLGLSDDSNRNLTPPSPHSSCLNSNHIPAGRRQAQAQGHLHTRCPSVLTGTPPTHTTSPPPPYHTPHYTSAPPFLPPPPLSRVGARTRLPRSSTHPTQLPPHKYGSRYLHPSSPHPSPEHTGAPSGSPQGPHSRPAPLPGGLSSPRGRASARPRP